MRQLCLLVFSTLVVVERPWEAPTQNSALKTQNSKPGNAKALPGFARGVYRSRTDDLLTASQTL